MVPQAPQFCGFLVRSTHSPAQLVVPVGQAHWAFWQTRFPPHTCWQNPQLDLSLFRSTHWLPHLASPDPHAIEQSPRLHTWPGWQ